MIIELVFSRQLLAEEPVMMIVRCTTSSLSVRPVYACSLCIMS